MMLWRHFYIGIVVGFIVEQQSHSHVELKAIDVMILWRHF